MIETLALFGIVGLLTFLIRLVPMALVGRHELPPLVLRGLRYVPPSVLTAIFVPDMLMPKGTVDLSLGNPRLLAGLVAIFTAYRTRSVLWTIAAGMAVLLLLVAVFGL
jgi:branched-subunit amino acid transport protein